MSDTSGRRIEYGFIISSDSRTAVMDTRTHMLLIPEQVSRKDYGGLTMLKIRAES